MRISHLLRAGLVVSAALFFTPLTALSQERCHEHAGHLVAEQAKDGQRVEAVAFNARGTLIWVLVNPEDRTWSIVFGPPEGRGCIPISGSDWDWLRESQQ